MMSDGENNESPKKEQVTMEQGADEQPAEEEEKENPADVSTESKEDTADTADNKVEPTEKETTATTDSPPKKPAVKRTPKKKPETEYVDDDEERLGLLERPVIIESGKREKRKVERLEMTGTITPNLQKKKVEVPEGTGEKLGDCPRIEHQLQKTRGEDLKVLHRVLFGRVSTPGMVKKNIRQFCGFPFTKEDKEHDKKIATLVKLNMPVLKYMCDVLDVERGGTKDALVNRLMEFLLNPKSSGKKVPQPKKRRRSGKGVKRKRQSSGKKGKAEEKGDGVENSDSELSPDEEDAGSGPDDKGDADTKEEEEEGSEEEEEEEESEEEEAPKKKKQKLNKTPKKQKIVKETKKEKPEKKVKEKPEKKVKEKPEKKVKEKPEKKEKKAASPKKQKVSKAVDIDDDSSDDEPLAKKESNEPPSDEDVKECIKKILEGANLEEVTMKTVLKQVYETYPDFDLSDRKTFIKNTVKQLIS